MERYNGPPYIDFCPVPARHGCILVVPARPDFFKRACGYKRAGHLRSSLAQLPDLVQTRGKVQNGLHTHPWPNLWPPTSNQRMKCDFHRAWSLYASLQGVEYVLEGGGRGPCPACSDGGGGGGAHTTGFWSPASEERGSGYACTTSMIRVDPGTSFMLYLGPGPPSLLYLTRANEISPHAGDTDAYAAQHTHQFSHFSNGHSLYPQ